MAQFEEASGYCINCKKQVLITRKKTNHLLHLILTLLTAGFWLIVWILAAITVDSWRCSQCGSKEISPTKTSEAKVRKWPLILGVLLVLIILIIAISSTEEEKEEEKKVSLPQKSKQVKAKPKISIKDYNMEIHRVRVDEVSFDKIRVLLKNEGNLRSEIDRLILSSGKTKIEDSPRPVLHALSPGEEKWCSLPTDFYPSLQKKIGADEIKATISVIGSSAQAVAKKDITIPIPIARIGDTIRRTGSYEESKSVSVTLLGWKQSRIASKTDMELIILSYRARNNGIRPLYRPNVYLDVGEIATKNGHIYEGRYEEISNLTDPFSYEKLLPNESIKGCVVFEIPKSEIPVEASVYGVPALIKFELSK